MGDTLATVWFRIDLKGGAMFNVFTNFKDFKGCDEGQRLWCFDCHTSDRQNRTWCVSDLGEDETRALAMRYAEGKYDLECFNFFDPCYVDFLGNYPWWVKSHWDTLMDAVHIEQGITDDDRDRQRKRMVATSMLRASGLNAHMREIERVVMADFIDT